MALFQLFALWIILFADRATALGNPVVPEVNNINCVSSIPKPCSILFIEQPDDACDNSSIGIVDKFFG